MALIKYKDSIEQFWDVWLVTFRGLWKWMDEGIIVRRLVLWWMIYMYTIAIHWAIGFAESTERTGAEIAAIIAAIMGPLALLQGAIFAFYTKQRIDTVMSYPKMLATAEKDSQAERVGGGRGKSRSKEKEHDDTEIVG